MVLFSKGNAPRNCCDLESIYNMLQGVDSQRIFNILLHHRTTQQEPHSK